MKIRRALFKIFGPVILAALLVVAVLIIPFASSGFNHRTIERAAVSQSKNVFKGVAVKQQALTKIMFHLWDRQSYPGCFTII